MTKKILAVLLALAMVLSLVSVNVFAADDVEEVYTYTWKDGTSNWHSLNKKWNADEFSKLLAAVETEGSVINVAYTGDAGWGLQIGFKNGDTNTMKSAENVKHDSTAKTASVSGSDLMAAVKEAAPDLDGMENGEFYVNTGHSSDAHDMTISVTVPKAAEPEVVPTNVYNLVKTVQKGSYGWCIPIMSKGSDDILKFMAALKEPEAVVAVSFSNDEATWSQFGAQETTGWGTTFLDGEKVEKSDDGSTIMFYGADYLALLTGDYAENNVQVIINGDWPVDEMGVAITVVALKPAPSTSAGNKPEGYEESAIKIDEDDLFYDESGYVGVGLDADRDADKYLFEFESAPAQGGTLAVLTGGMKTVKTPVTPTLPAKNRDGRVTYDSETGVINFSEQWSNIGWWFNEPATFDTLDIDFPNGAEITVDVVVEYTDGTERSTFAVAAGNKNITFEPAGPIQQIYLNCSQAGGGKLTVGQLGTLSSQIVLECDDSITYEAGSKYVEVDLSKYKGRSVVLLAGGEGTTTLDIGAMKVTVPNPNPSLKDIKTVKLYRTATPTLKAPGLKFARAINLGDQYHGYLLDNGAMVVMPHKFSGDYCTECGYTK